MECITLNTIVTILGIVFAVIFGNAAIFLPIIAWMRNDINSYEGKIGIDLDRFQKDFSDKFEKSGKIFDSWRADIKNEMRDFHGRLCAIEEKNRKK